VLEKGHGQPRGILGIGQEHGGGQSRNDELPDKLVAGRKPLVLLFDHLGVVVHEAQGAKTHVDEHGHPDVAVGQIAP